MPIFKRLSDSFWSYVSPSRPTDRAQATPTTVPRFRQPAGSAVRATEKQSRSAGPVDRVSKRRANASSTRFSTPGSARVRKRAHSPASHARHSQKTRRTTGSSVGARMMDEGDISIRDGEFNEDEDVSMGEADDPKDNGEESEGNEEPQDSSQESTIQVGTSASPSGYDDDDNELFTSHQKQLLTPAPASIGEGLSEEELRAQGWDEDHISLVQRLAMRGYEPIMPAFWHFDFRHWMPDNLFSENDEAIISSVRDNQNEARVALERLFGFGSWVRDALLSNGNTTPELQVRKYLQEYIRWADRDSGLNLKTAIPLLTIQLGNADTSPQVLKDNAERRLAKLALRYRQAFRARQSIENSPMSGSTQLSSEIPTLYAIIASHTLVALVAYRPNEAHPEIKSVAFFDMSDKDYDVWNAFALAITICHLRNVQMRIAEETGLGASLPGEIEDESDDPDL